MAMVAAREDPALMRHLEQISAAGGRGAELVRQILTVARQQPRPRGAIRLQPVIEEVASLIRATIPAGIEIAVSCDDAAPTVVADPSQVHQVLMNLCTNAWHAIEGLTGRIAVRLRRRVLDGQTAAALGVRPGPYAAISVSDDGVLRRPR